MRSREWMLLVVLSGSIALRAARSAQVEVHVSDAYGNSLPAQRVTLASKDGSAIEVKQDEPAEVGYGKYTVEVIVPGASKAVEEFTVDQPNQILTVAMKLGALEAPVPTCSVDGRVVPAAGVTRIRLLQLFGSYYADVPASGAGAFRFENLPCGDYMLIAVGPKGCIGTKMSRATTAGAHVEMKLADLRGGACAPDK
jgi:hypothetical protein